MSDKIIIALLAIALIALVCFKPMDLELDSCERAFHDNQHEYFECRKHMEKMRINE